MVDEGCGGCSWCGVLLMGHYNISGHYSTLSPLLRSEGGVLARLALGLCRFAKKNEEIK